MKTTKSHLNPALKDDSSEIYIRNINILAYLDRLNKIKFRDSQYLEKKNPQKSETKKRHKKNAASLPDCILFNKINIVESFDITKGNLIYFSKLKVNERDPVINYFK